MKSIISVNKTMLSCPGLLGVNIYETELVRSDNYAVSVRDIVMPPNAIGKWNDPETNLILVLLDGSVLVDNTFINEEATILLPAGRETSVIVDARKPAHFLAYTRAAVKKNDAPVISKHSELLWFPLFEDGEQHFILQELLPPEILGFNIWVLDYPAGYNTVWHTHPCAHGIYVQEGVLSTHEGFLGPGSFIWAPAGQKMEHGAAPDSHCRLIFITDSPFDITYL